MSTEREIFYIALAPWNAKLVTKNPEYIKRSLENWGIWIGSTPEAAARQADGEDDWKIWLCFNGMPQWPVGEVKDFI